MEKLLEFFSENNGNLSSTRLNCTLMTWAGIAILIGGAFKLSNAALDTTTITAAFGLIGAGTGQKLIQKSQELTAEKSERQ